MGEPLADLHRADRLVYGGSLYPPPDVPAPYSRRLAALIIIVAAVAAWVVVCLMVWPVLL